MTEGVNLIRVFSGSEITVLLLKEELENIGIASIVKNEFSSGVVAGFATSVPSVVDLYIQEADLAEAKPLVEEFLRQND